jgi:hypothetical protein
VLIVARLDEPRADDLGLVAEGAPEVEVQPLAAGGH